MENLSILKYILQAENLLYVSRAQEGCKAESASPQEESVLTTYGSIFF